MRAIARRFAPASHDPRTDQAEQLRLLTQPLYRFAADASGVIDGALFAYVVSNDPELLLLLEAVRDRATGITGWQFSLARMSSRKQVVRVEDKQIWEVPNFSRDPNEDRMTGPYVEKRMGSFRSNR
ncbi:MAG: hypothetical protein HY000_10170 [Planctomycetes bacterium]|nr:hypothetical protein [Planctomycetota bacterium]